MSGGDAPNPTHPKHVWVDVTGGFGGPHTFPGILLEWRQQASPPHRWEALVGYAESSAHSWSMTTRWVLAEHVRQA